MANATSVTLALVPDTFGYSSLSFDYFTTDVPMTVLGEPDLTGQWIDKNFGTIFNIVQNGSSLTFSYVYLGKTY